MATKVQIASEDYPHVQPTLEFEEIPGSVIIDNDEQLPIQIPVGFCNPLATDIVSKSELKDMEGDKKFCVAPIIYSPSEFYLSSVKDFPSKVDEFVRKMTSFYGHLGTQPRSHEFTVDPRLLLPGAIVAFKRNLPDDNPKEWVRARVLRQVGKDASNAFKSEVQYLIQLLDFGEYYTANQSELIYLHQYFARQPTFVIKSRFRLKSSYFGRYHSGRKVWDKDARQRFFEAFSHKTAYIQFLRKVEDKQDYVWEVSLLEFQRPVHNFKFMKEGGVPFQEQMVDDIMVHKRRVPDDTWSTTTTTSNQTEWEDSEYFYSDEE